MVVNGEGKGMVSESHSCRSARLRPCGGCIGLQKKLERVQSKLEKLEKRLERLEEKHSVKPMFAEPSYNTVVF